MLATISFPLQSMIKNSHSPNLNSGISLLVFILASFFSITAFPQTYQTLPDPAAESSNSEGGFFKPAKTQCLSHADRNLIWAAIRENRALLAERGILPSSENLNRNSVTLLQWPLKLKNGLTDYGYHGIANFVDEDLSFPNNILDYNCGDRSYDLASGYNHAGTDIYTWPFSWLKMDSSQVEVIAAAPGTIIFKQDGNFDRSCAFGGTWNAIFVQHADGSTAWYGHMKNGSLTAKNVGQTVAIGEFLGVVGSSGSSTGPHLHIEIYDNIGNLVDPWNGPCNSMNPGQSWWANQRPYYDPSVNKLMTQSDPTDWGTCPDQEIPFAKDLFCAGERVYFVTYYRDQLNIHLSSYKVYRPDNSIWQQWTHSSPAAYYSSSWWYWWYTLPANPMTGTWRFEVNFNGVTYTHSFKVGKAPTLATITPIGNDLQANTGPGYQYQWYLAGLEIPGATNSLFTPGQSGFYTVSVSDSIGCSLLSSAYFYTLASLVPYQNSSLGVFPNPGNGHFLISTPFEAGTEAEIKIINSLGQVFQRESVRLSATAQNPVSAEGGQLQVDLDKNLTEGVYWICLSQGNREVWGKLILTK